MANGGGGGGGFCGGASPRPPGSCWSHSDGGFCRRCACACACCVCRCSTIIGVGAGAGHLIVTLSVAVGFGLIGRGFDDLRLGRRLLRLSLDLVLDPRLHMGLGRVVFNRVDSDLHLVSRLGLVQFVAARALEGIMPARGFGFWISLHSKQSPCFLVLHNVAAVNRRRRAPLSLWWSIRR